MKHVCSCTAQTELLSFGALAQVQLLPHPIIRAARAASGSYPEPTVMMMVDTGAARTVIERRIAESLGLTPIRFDPMIGVSQKIEYHPVYMMTMRIAVEENNGVTGSLDFDAQITGMESPPIPTQHAGLIGRDFLRMVHVIYNGPKGNVELHLSSQITKKAVVKHPKAKNKKKR